MLAGVCEVVADESRLAGSIEADLGGSIVQFPSVASNIDIDLQGDLARVRVTQRFVNPLAEPVHARYLFPLNKEAAVFGLTMHVGSERIRAVIQEKRAAQKTFEAGKQAGKAAALLTQQRPNMFTQRLANLMPGLPIEVVLEYTHAVNRVDGAYELVVPLVVGPRYTPPASGDLVPAHPPLLGAPVPDVIDPNRVTLDLRLSSAIGVARLESDTHHLDVQEESGSVVRARLAQHSVQANRDLVVRYQLGLEDELAAGALAYADERGGFFSVLVEPPEHWQEEQVLPREMVFLLDCSGSMSGLPIEASKAFMRAALSNLRPNDTFRIIRFSDYATEFSRHPLPATAANVQAGLNYTDALSGSGGTVMRAGIEQALLSPQAQGSVRNVVFLTDGYIGNEYEILGLLNAELGAARLFALGVGSGVNRFLLDELARVGRGFVRYLDPLRPVDEQVQELTERLQTPLLTDLRVDWGTTGAFGVTPGRLPDLYAGDSLRIQGRYQQAGQHQILLTGRSGGKRVRLPLDIELPEPGNATVTEHGEVIANVWARGAIGAAMQQLSVPQQLRIDERTDAQLQQHVTQLGLEHSLLTRWTAFVAVSEEIYNPAAHATAERPVPLARPAGTRFGSTTALVAAKPVHGGYAAPEPSSWASVLLLLVFFFWLYRKRLILAA